MATNVLHNPIGGNILKSGWAQGFLSATGAFMGASVLFTNCLSPKWRIEGAKEVPLPIDEAQPLVRNVMVTLILPEGMIDPIGMPNSSNATRTMEIPTPDIDAHLSAFSISMFFAILAMFALLVAVFGTVIWQAKRINKLEASGKEAESFNERMDDLEEFQKNAIYAVDGRYVSTSEYLDSRGDERRRSRVFGRRLRDLEQASHQLNASQEIFTTLTDIKQRRLDFDLDRLGTRWDVAESDRAEYEERIQVLEAQVKNIPELEKKAQTADELKKTIDGLLVRFESSERAIDAINNKMSADSKAMAQLKPEDMTRGPQEMNGKTEVPSEEDTNEVQTTDQSLENQVRPPLSNSGEAGKARGPIRIYLGSVLPSRQGSARPMASKPKVSESSVTVQEDEQSTVPSATEQDTGSQAQEAGSQAQETGSQAQTQAPPRKILVPVLRRPKQYSKMAEFSGMQSGIADTVSSGIGNSTSVATEPSSTELAGPVFGTTEPQEKGSNVEISAKSDESANASGMAGSEDNLAAEQSKTGGDDAATPVSSEGPTGTSPATAEQSFAESAKKFDDDLDSLFED
ncbi:hypothetical protein BS50DRAFT_650812 [Corynespora cassiicola Philippines]|uniref:Uncharacterized protein n=1 Tax=Corynespora cassiicola Philippines TaxID=1448308 RepID=A0A2T2NA52_CORCC|nr:hypothetical protein BS50DRAFT_650812 [Corynespora cassiicola Philippines]